MKTGTQPSLEDAIAGRYDFNIKAIFSEAWKKTDGLKGRFWKALILVLIITIVTTMIAFSVDAMFFPANNPEAAMAPHPVAQLLQMVFSIFLTTPLFAGLLMLCIKQCVGVFAPFNTVFQYVSYWKKLWAYPVAMTVLALASAYSADIPMMRFIVFLLMTFIVVTYFMFIPLVVEKNLSTWEAMEASRKTIFHHWLKTLWFMIVIGLIMVASALTLGIALIWTLPWIYNAIAMLYITMFGVQEKT